MQIVIDVPNIDYETIMLDKQYDARRLTHYERVIANGIPLPKGHGRLIDADRLWDSYHDLGYDFYEAFDLADTIIEADTESEVQQ